MTGKVNFCGGKFYFYFLGAKFCVKLKFELVAYLTPPTWAGISRGSVPANGCLLQHYPELLVCAAVVCPRLKGAQRTSVSEEKFYYLSRKAAKIWNGGALPHKMVDET